MSTGERLKRLRSQKKITQQQLTDLIGINRATYARYETNDTQADYDTLKKIAEFFGVTTDYLLGRTDLPYSDAVQKRIDSLDIPGEFNPFLIFELVDKMTDDEIINQYHHQAAGKDIDEETVRTHLKFVRLLRSQKK